jgi:hypothetical protein
MKGSYTYIIHFLRPYLWPRPSGVVPEKLPPMLEFLAEACGKVGE